MTNVDLKGLTMIFTGQENPLIIFRSKDRYTWIKFKWKNPYEKISAGMGKKVKYEIMASPFNLIVVLRICGIQIETYPFEIHTFPLKTIPKLSTEHM